MQHIEKRYCLRQQEKFLNQHEETFYLNIDHFIIAGFIVEDQ